MGSLVPVYLHTLAPTGWWKKWSEVEEVDLEEVEEVAGHDAYSPTQQQH